MALLGFCFLTLLTWQDWNSKILPITLGGCQNFCLARLAFQLLFPPWFPFSFLPHRCIFGVSQKFEGCICRFWDSILSSFPLFQSIQPWILATVITLDLIPWFLRPIELWLSTWDVFSTGIFVSNFVVKALQMWISPSVIPMWVIYCCVTNYPKKIALETVSLVLKQAQLNWVFWIRVSYKVSTKALARAGVSSEGLSGKGFTPKLMW